ncbi:hypothetical protein FFLO_00029 [Filobasidium floriforme]|uniref:Transcription elongation factor 1 homolog n=1 Tax=Filobasidium floriforme TaxID=5210 RepID=A0A8K0JS36_9TREE|nr:hypothetical protein FFLO_00029 [Filobasidium floriforme]
MGKRKSSSKPMAKKGPGKIGQSFDCVYCATDKSVNMTFSKPNNRWHLLCGACDATWDMDCGPGQKLEPIDVAIRWIDAAEEVRQEEEKARQAQAARRTTQKKTTATTRTRSASPDRNRTQRGRSRSEEREREREAAQRLQRDFDDDDDDDDDAEGEDDDAY